MQRKRLHRGRNDEARGSLNAPYDGVRRADADETLTAPDLIGQCAAQRRRTPY
jgi:hypothetical protein